MLSPEDRIMDVFYKNYPDLDKDSADRNCVADVLEFVIHEFQDYREFGCGEMVVSCGDLWELIDELRDL